MAREVGEAPSQPLCQNGARKRAGASKHPTQAEAGTTRHRRVKRDDNDEAGL